MTPTPEEIKEALEWFDALNDERTVAPVSDEHGVTLAAAFRQLRDAQPRTWSAEMDSAPKDGTEILLVIEHFMVYKTVLTKWDGKFWMGCHGCEAKCWMPCPQPPVAAVTDGSAA